MVASSPKPTRLPAGLTTDPPFGPLADSGYGNPFFYHEFSDDFDNTLGPTGLWTVSKGSTGTAVHTAGDGGLATLTTAATLNDYVSIQLPAADFSLPQSTLAGKKLFFLCRLNLSDVTASAFVAGLCDTTATVFTAITDGVYFKKASGGTVLDLVTASGGTSLTWAIPVSAYALANNVNIDLAFYMDRLQNLNVFVGSQLVGFIPQSGTGGVNSAGVSQLPVIGRCLQIVPTGTVPSGNQLGPWTISAANLNPTLGIQAGAAAAKALVADFIGAQKER